MLFYMCIPFYFQMKFTKEYNIKAALRKWGTCHTRPQDVSREFLKFRVNINNRIFPLVNPYSSTILSWKLTEEMITTPTIKDKQNYVFIDTVQDLSNLASELKKHRTIAVDTESHSFESFLHMICLLQISTVEKDYIVDTLVLFDKINFYLREVFENSKQLKIVHGNTEVRALQRDFNIYSTAVIDLQEVYHNFAGGVENASLQVIVNDLLEANIQKGKLAQLADWRERPLNSELLHYASNDSRFILRCWYSIKDSDPEKLLEMSFENSKKYTELVYHFPETSDPFNLWKRNIQRMSPDLKKVFNTIGQRALFLELANIIVSKAKEVDRPIKDILKTKDLGFICRRMPDTTGGILKILKTSVGRLPTLVTIEMRKHLLKIINKHRDSMHTFENSKLIIDTPVTSQEREVRPLTRDEAMQLEITLDEIESAGEITTDSECEIDYDSREIALDLNNWQVSDEQILPTSSSVLNSSPMASTSTTTHPTTLNKSKRPIRKNRTGKLQKIKRIFFLAAKMGLTKEDLKNSLSQFPKVNLIGN